MTREAYGMTIADGKVEARVDSSVFDSDSSIRQSLHEALSDRFLGVQVLTHRPYQLSGPTMTRLHPDGRRDRFIEPESGEIKLSGETLDIQVRDKDDNVLMDTRRERVHRKGDLAELVEKYRAKDAVLASLLRSYHAAVRDPDNELVHLFEIRDALTRRFEGETEARSVLGISSRSWSRLGRLANAEPLRQGRHRGKAEGPLRDATESELAEARVIALRLNEAYLGYLDATNCPEAGS